MRLALSARVHACGNMLAEYMLMDSIKEADVSMSIAGISGHVQADDVVVIWLA